MLDAEDVIGQCRPTAIEVWSGDEVPLSTGLRLIPGRKRWRAPTPESVPTGAREPWKRQAKYSCDDEDDADDTQIDPVR